MEALDISKPVRFQNLLLATDFSPSSRSALLYSLALARHWKAHVYVAHVVSPTTIFGQDAAQRAINDAWREANTEITNQLIAGRLQGVAHQVVIRQGEVWDELQRMIGEFHIDLVVTGTRGRSGVWKLLLGSVAEKIFRNSPVPVLTVGPNAPADVPTEGARQILYSTGFAAQSLHAGKYALTVAEENQARLAMLHVIRELPPGTDREQLRCAAEQKLRALVPAGVLPAPPEIFVEFGDVADCMLAVAAQWRPDLIVLGIRRHPQEEGRAAWATAYDVVANAPCPVLTVKTPE